MKTSALISALGALFVSPVDAFAPHSKVQVSVPVSSKAGMTMLLGGGSSGKRFSLTPNFGVPRRGRSFGPNGKGNVHGGNNNGGNHDGGVGGGNGGNGVNNGEFDEFEWNGKRDVFSVMLAGALWDSYNDALDKKPLLTKMSTSLVGFAIGDILAQKFVNKGSKFNTAQLLRMAAFGFLLHGSTGHYFYGFLDEKLPGTEPLTVAMKVAIDQILWAPVFGILFFTFLGLAQGDAPNKIAQKIQKDLIPAVVGSWSVWPVAHTINFAFIPPEQRLLYINSIQIGYNVFLSVIGSRK